MFEYILWTLVAATFAYLCFLLWRSKRKIHRLRELLTYCRSDCMLRIETRNKIIEMLATQIDELEYKLNSKKK